MTVTTTDEIIMKRKEILHKIVGEKGSCEWVFETFKGCNVCAFCPFSQMAQRKNGEYMGCYDAVCGEQTGLQQGEVDALYLQAAQDLLLKIAIEESVGFEYGDYIDKEEDTK